MLVIDGLLVLGVLFCGVQAIRGTRLLLAALWLAGVSSLTAIWLYRLGAYEVAVIELSVGAGLVTILFVFAIALAGEGGMGLPTIVPRWLAGVMVLGGLVAVAWLLWPIVGTEVTALVEPPFAIMLWERRGLDVLVQIGLIFAGVLGVLGLLGESVPQTNTSEIPQEKECELSEPEQGEEVFV